MPTYSLEYAKSGRSGCKGTCKDKIEKGHIRLGSSVEGDGFERVYWRHFPECATGRVVKNIKEALGSVEKITGFEDLKEADKKKVATGFEELLNEGDEKPATKKAKKSKPADEDEDDEELAEDKPAKKKAAPKKRSKATEETNEGKPKTVKAANKSPAAKKNKKTKKEDEDVDDE